MKEIKMILTNKFISDIRVYKEAKYLVSIGYEVEIICWDRENDLVNNEFDKIDGIRIKRFFPYAKYGSGLKQLIPYLKFLFQVKKYLKGKRYDFLHCHDLDATIVGFFSKSRKTKLVFDMHELYGSRGISKILKPFIILISKVCQNKSYAVVYVNPIQLELVRLKKNVKRIYIPNYPDLSMFSNTFKTHSDKLRISYIGSVRQYRELINLITATKNLDNVIVKIHGAGTAMEKLKRETYNIPNVEVTGEYHFSESEFLYNNTDLLYAVYDMNSYQNRISYPIKFFEAIITGTPLIVSKGSILENEVINYDLGYIVDGSCVREIFEEIKHINKNSQSFINKMKNVEKIKSSYLWENIVKNFNEIY